MAAEMTKLELTHDESMNWNLRFAICDPRLSGNIHPDFISKSQTTNRKFHLVSSSRVIRISSFRSNRRPAFTLVELILVMLILTFVAAIVAPSLRGFGTGRKKSDMATMLVGLAGYARTQAMTEGQTYRLAFSTGQTPGFQLMVQDGPKYVPVPNENGEMIQMPDGLQLRTDIAQQPDGVHIDFRPDGRTDPAHIWFTDRLGGTVEVGCESATELFRVVPAEEMTR
jgi:prepilin-type N-terminal cleavage/methylation domain-containing protein